jgi:hypothetical protein
VRECSGVADDVAACGDGAAGFRMAPACGCLEGVVGIPGDVAAASAEAGDRAVNRTARVAVEHRLPDGEHPQLRVRVGDEDVLSDPTGPDATDRSGG